MTDETLDPVILEPGDDGTWTHRYGPAPEGYGYRGKTVCCERAVYAPLNSMSYAIDSVLIDDCCETPGVPKPVVLPPYTGEHATCRKCGSKAVETKFTRRTQSPYGVGPMGYPPEWLARRCTVCQATWDESTAPARREPRAARYPVGGPLPAHDYPHLSDAARVFAGLPPQGERADRYRAAIDTALGHLNEVGTIAAGVPAEGIAARVNAARDILRKAVGDE